VRTFFGFAIGQMTRLEARSRDKTVQHALQRAGRPGMMGLIGGDRIGRSRSDRRRISMAWRTTTAGCTLMFVLLALGSATAADPLADEFFERDVRPLLADRCLKCHGPQKQKGGLRLDSRASILQGGETGPAAVPGTP
jgi:hypothetical protein